MKARVFSNKAPRFAIKVLGEAQLEFFELSEDSQVGKVGLPPRGCVSHFLPIGPPISADHSAAALASFCTSPGHHQSLSTLMGSHSPK